MKNWKQEVKTLKESNRKLREEIAEDKKLIEDITMVISAKQTEKINLNHEIKALKIKNEEQNFVLPKNRYWFLDFAYIQFFS